MDTNTLTVILSYSTMLIGVIGVWTWIIVNTWTQARVSYATGYEAGRTAGAREMEDAVRREVAEHLRQRTAALEDSAARIELNGSSPERRQELRKATGAA